VSLTKVLGNDFVYQASGATSGGLPIDSLANPLKQIACTHGIAASMKHIVETALQKPQHFSCFNRSFQLLEY
jgi:hypothetical protein